LYYYLFFVFGAAFAKTEFRAIDGKYDAHLHVTYFSFAQSGHTEHFIKGINGKNLYTDINYENGSVRNPFNIESRKTENKYRHER